MATINEVRRFSATRGGQDRTPARYRPGAVWVRKKDGETFVLSGKDLVGLRFKNRTGSFSEDMFRPK